MRKLLAPSDHDDADDGSSSNNNSMEYTTMKSHATTIEILTATAFTITVETYLNERNTGVCVNRHRYRDAGTYVARKRWLCHNSLRLLSRIRQAR
jgi:hypothetical protein